MQVCDERKRAAITTQNRWYHQISKACVRSWSVCCTHWKWLRSSQGLSLAHRILLLWVCCKPKLICDEIIFCHTTSAAKALWKPSIQRHKELGIYATLWSHNFCSDALRRFVKIPRNHSLCAQKEMKGSIRESNHLFFDKSLVYANFLFRPHLQCALQFKKNYEPFSMNN